MKKVIFSIALFSISLWGNTQTITNAKGSEYSFTEIAKLDATPVQSQGYTGTCWSFSALSFFESEIKRMGMENPPLLSEMFIVHKAYQEKAKRYVQLNGKGNFSQGGEFDNIPYVFKKYGIVPQSAYKGLNYGTDRHNHKELYDGVNGYVQGIIEYIKTKRSRPLSYAWKEGLNGILDAYLGEIPEKFTYEGKEYTPKSFAEFTGIEMDNYVGITSFMNKPMHEEVKIFMQDNWLWKDYYNVTLDELFEIAVAALKNGYTMAWAADVSEKGFSFRKGLAIVPKDMSTIKKDDKEKEGAFYHPVEELEITPELRQKGYDQKVTTDDHGMHITGLYKDQNGTHYFLVKNSWGTGNFPEGYFYVSENYFKYKTMDIFLHKDAIPKKIANTLGIE